MPRIVVADDSDLDRELTGRALQKVVPGWEFVIEEDGSLLDQWLSSEERPVLVLLDFKMLRMGAAEVLASSGKAYWEKVPAVLFSSAVSPTDVARCVDLGAREYVEKPTDPSEYTEAIRGICKRWLPQA